MDVLDIHMDIYLEFFCQIFKEIKINLISIIYKYNNIRVHTHLAVSELKI